MKNISNDCVQFEPPEEVNAEIMQNGEVLLIELNFPGIRKLDTSYPGTVRQRSNLFSCFSSNKNSSPIKEYNWRKVMDNRKCSTAIHSGEWVSIQMDKRPVNCDLWLRILRRRISVILTPQKKERSTVSFTDILGVTRYYFWDSGRLNRILNPGKSEILITDDSLSLRLVCDGELWTDEDAKALRDVLKKEKLNEVFGETQHQFPEGDVGSDRKHFASISLKEKVMGPDRIKLKEEYGEKKALHGVNTNANESTPNKIVSEGAINFDAKAEGKIRETNEQEQHLGQEPLRRIEFVERAISCTDIRELVDASIATSDQITDEEMSKPCQYCLGVQEEVGIAEFSALQARVEAMNRAQWARVLDIIVGKNDTSNLPPLRLERASNEIDGDVAKKVRDNSNGAQEAGKKRPPARNARYVIQNRNRTDVERCNFGSARTSRK